MHNKYDIQTPDFAAKNIQAVDVIRGKNFIHHYKDGRTCHGFIYIVRGAMRCDFQNDPSKSIHMIAGDILFVPKGTVYSSTYLEDDTQIKIVQFELAGGRLPDYLQQPLKPKLPNAGESVHAFWKPQQSLAFGHPFYSLSCFYKLMWQLEVSQAKIPTKYKRLQPALTELSSNYLENRPIGYYASLCAMSEPTFRRLFREYTGQSPVDHRNALRLNDARVKLQSGEYNVSEAAETSGFSNLSFFIRLYKKKYGYTPKKE